MDLPVKRGLMVFANTPPCMGNYKFPPVVTGLDGQGSVQVSFINFYKQIQALSRECAGGSLIILTTMSKVIQQNSRNESCGVNKPK